MSLDSVNCVEDGGGEVIYVLEECLQEQQLEEGQIYQLEQGGEGDEDGETSVYTVYEENNKVEVVPSVENEEEIGMVEIDDNECDEIIYVTEDGERIEGEVTFMQVGGPDVANEETIETSMIVEVPEDENNLIINGDISNNPAMMASDHCYTFKRGIRPKTIERVKTKSETTTISNVGAPSSGYTFILPKNPITPQIFLPNSIEATNEIDRIIVPGTPAGRVRASNPTKVNKHRWLWQFMKELLFVGDPSLQWFNQRDGSFMLRDQDGLAIKWECYKRLHKMKAQVWRQMRYYFGWMEENKIVKPVPECENRYQFHEKFYREKFLPYKFRPHADLVKIRKMASEMDPSTDFVLTRYRSGAKEKVFCIRGCGSQFINKEACERHESVCTFSRTAEAIIDSVLEHNMVEPLERVGDNEQFDSKPVVQIHQRQMTQLQPETKSVIRLPSELESVIQMHRDRGPKTILGISEHQ